MTDVSFGVTIDEALGGMREVVGALVVDKTLLEVENQKLKNTVTEQQRMIERMELQLVANQEQINAMYKAVEEGRKKRYKPRVKKKPAAQT